MSPDTKKALLEELFSKKKELFVSKMKFYSDDRSYVKNLKKIKKEVARILTKININDSNKTRILEK